MKTKARWSICVVAWLFLYLKLEVKESIKREITKKIICSSVNVPQNKKWLSC